MNHPYVRYVTRKYGTAAIVFDGYNDDPTTKDATHLRRTGYCVGGDSALRQWNDDQI